MLRDRDKTMAVAAPGGGRRVQERRQNVDRARRRCRSIPDSGNAEVGANVEMRIPRAVENPVLVSKLWWDRSSEIAGAPFPGIGYAQSDFGRCVVVVRETVRKGGHLYDRLVVAVVSGCAIERHKRMNFDYYDTASDRSRRRASRSGGNESSTCSSVSEKSTTSAEPSANGSGRFMSCCRSRSWRSRARACSSMPAETSQPRRLAAPFCFKYKRFQPVPQPNSMTSRRHMRSQSFERLGGRRTPSGCRSRRRSSTSGHKLQ